MSMLVLGIGNPVFTDDAVGIKIVRKLKIKSPEREARTLPLSYFRLYKLFYVLKLVLCQDSC